MIRYLEFQNIASAQAVADALSTAMGFPDLSTGTMAYTRPLPHPTDGRALLPIGSLAYAPAQQMVIDPRTLLNQSQRDALQLRSWARAQGWFAPVAPRL